MQWIYSGFFSLACLSHHLSASQEQRAGLPQILTLAMTALLFVAIVLSSRTGLGGIELIFFIAPSVVLWFVFVLKTDSITQGLFSYCSTVQHSIKVFSVSHAVLAVSRQGVHCDLGGDTASTADPGWPKGCPTHNVMTHDDTISTKSCGEERVREDVWSYHVCLPK